jgi:cyclic beta-1,2-glucan synthetase
VSEAEDFDIVRQLLRAHEYWRLKLLPVDLVILNEHGATYAHDFAGQLEALVRTSQSRLVHDGPASQGGVHLLPAEQLSAEDRTLIEAIARVVVVGRRGTLADQVIRVDRAAPREPTPSVARRGSQMEAPPAVATDLEFFNGLGGFADDGREYVIVLGPGQATPAPWSNVVANPEFGFLVTESGGGYTWAGNSRENQVTPWSNDPVGDPVGEAIYVRDDETGEVWSPCPQPVRVEESTYVVHHGRGYSRFEHDHDGIGLDLVQFVPLDDHLKISTLTIENRSGRPRRLSVTAYVEWVLGVSRGAGAHRIVTSVEPTTGALLARDPWNTEFAGHLGVLDLRGRQTGWTADRTEFLGRNGGPDRPAGLDLDHHLQGRAGAGLDPCGALQTTIELAPRARTQVVVLLGEAADEAAAAELVLRGRALDLEAARREVDRHWEDVTGAIQVRTPERTMDVMVNGWLLYQTLACRVWGRTAFYQAGGAFGFRDQLQDVLALLEMEPAVARAQIVAASARQFLEGDVQHWWHPPSGAGVRTRISDDRLWLPYVVHRYREVTGDASILDEPVSWLEGAALTADQDDAYFRPDVAGPSTSVYEHCAAAIDVSLGTGAHGLPLMGSGDWNDGMNRVGRDGGESVWLGWFLATVLTMFVPVAEERGDRRRAKRWRAQATALREALERHGWDGSWYRRAYFGDGMALGSALNEACRIDAIAQSWSVLSGVADPDRATKAMAAADEQLVRREDGLALLFTPPFDGGAVDPGYIKGYVPGIRENGGQYTHGAIWSIIAQARLGDGDKAGELFAMLNPINHARTRAGVLRYKVEPYVISADVYSEPPHVGRGGWTWYTGSAGWMYQAAVEWLLGIRRHGTSLAIDPCIPRSWPGFEVELRHGAATYHITVDNAAGVSRGVVRAEIDGDVPADPTAPLALVDDGAEHRIHITLGEPPDRPTPAVPRSPRERRPRPAATSSRTETSA